MTKSNSSVATRPRADISELLDVMRQLRDPHHGCPWDVQQTFATIAPYTIEEAYEVADAIARDNVDDVVDELGDLLLQVVFHAQMANEQDQFDFANVTGAIVAKMVRRHPHVFADAVVADAAAQTESWEAIKTQERGTDNTASVLDSVARGLPAFLRAAKLQRKAARQGFDWPTGAGVLDKLDEELKELREASNATEREAELGDLLFTCVNYARHCGIDPEAALLRANLKFETRFRHMESAAPVSLNSYSPAQLAALWDDAKRAGVTANDDGFDDNSLKPSS